MIHIFMKKKQKDCPSSKHLVIKRKRRLSKYKICSVRLRTWSETPILELQRRLRLQVLLCYSAGEVDLGSVQLCWLLTSCSGRDSVFREQGWERQVKTPVVLWPLNMNMGDTCIYTTYNTPCACAHTHTHEHVRGAGTWIILFYFSILLQSLENWQDKILFKMA